MTDTTPLTYTLEQFPPGDLLMDENVRTDAAATVTPAFIASIKATNGNLAPVLLMRRPDGTTLRVWDGARRTLACGQLGLKVNGIIIGDDGDEQADRRARILQQMILNDDREKLTTADRAAAMLTLFDTEGMTIAGIAKATGRDKTEVDASLRVARSEVASKAADKWSFLTLEQAAVIAEFDGDPYALTELAKAAKLHPEQFGHVAQQLRDSAVERAQKEALVAELEAGGCQVTDNRQDPHQLRWHNLRNYVAADGTDLTLESHAQCPYRAVRIDTELVWPPEAEAAWRADPENADYLQELRDADETLGPDEQPAVEFDTDEEAVAAGWVVQWVPDQGFCTDPAEAGHKDRYSAGQMSGGSSRDKPEPGSAEAEKAKEERRLLLSRNREWRSATVERTKHLKTLLARKDLKPKTLADAALTHIVDAIARGEAAPEKSGEGHALAANLLGLTGEKYAGGRDLITTAAVTAAPGRRLVLGLAMVLAGAEGDDGTYGCCADVHTWQSAVTAAPRYGNSMFHSDLGRAARHLLFLETHTGYTLSDLERMVAHPETRPAPDVAPPAAETDTGGGVMPDGPSGDGTAGPRAVREAGAAVCSDPPAESCADAGCPVHGDLEVEDPPITGPDEDEFDTTAAVEASADMDAHAEEAVYDDEAPYTSE